MIRRALSSLTSAHREGLDIAVGFLSGLAEVDAVLLDEYVRPESPLPAA